MFKNIKSCRIVHIFAFFFIMSIFFESQYLKQILFSRDFARSRFHGNTQHLIPHNITLSSPIIFPYNFTVI